MPDLKRNLISLDMLNQMGCSIKIKSGEIMIVKGFEFFMKRSRKNSFFFLGWGSSYWWNWYVF